jgi:hypothetical protein
VRGLDINTCVRARPRVCACVCVHVCTCVCCSYVRVCACVCAYHFIIKRLYRRSVIVVTVAFLMCRTCIYTYKYKIILRTTYFYRCVYMYKYYVGEYARTYTHFGRETIDYTGARNESPKSTRPRSTRVRIYFTIHTCTHTFTLYTSILIMRRFNDLRR